MERFQTDAYEGIVSGSDTRLQDGVLYTRAWTITNNSPDVGLKTVIVTVSSTLEGSRTAPPSAPFGARDDELRLFSVSTASERRSARKTEILQGRRQSGFTLVELFIVVVLASFLGATVIEVLRRQNAIFRSEARFRWKWTRTCGRAWT